MPKQRVLIVPLIVVLLALSIVPSALAAGSAPDAPGDPGKPNDPGTPDLHAIAAIVDQLAAQDAKGRAAMWENLPQETREAVLQYSMVARIEAEEVADEVTAFGCDTKHVYARGISYLGTVLWEYHEQISWCFDGTYVTSGNYLSWANLIHPLWQFLGHVGQYQNGGAGYTYYEAFTQGSFALCLGGCIDHKYPWVQMLGFGTGLYDWLVNNG